MGTKGFKKNRGGQGFMNKKGSERGPGRDIQNSQRNESVRIPVRWMLLVYDSIVYLIVSLALLVIYPSSIDKLTAAETIIIMLVGYICVTGFRLLLAVYQQIWRYGGMQAYIRLILADVIGGTIFILIRNFAFIPRITLPRAAALFSINLLGAMTLRIVYQYLYQSSYTTTFMRGLRWVLNRFAGMELGSGGDKQSANRIKIAIVGAGSVGVMLASELMRNPKAVYDPVCFIDTNPMKIGRVIYGIRVLSEEEITYRRLAELSVQEIVFALPQMDAERKRKLYEQYKGLGCKVKVYDYPTMQSVTGGKRQLREFRIEELLFRQVLNFTDEQTSAYYRDRTVLITGGGGSIGSELCRQIAKMQPKKLVILDIYENGAYDVQQELHIAYGEHVEIEIEVASVCDAAELEKIFARHRPEIVLHAAAHKHVPLMEHNVCEAIKNNVFGTWNVLEASRKYGVKRFIMISSDKAVNPTNVMGATKRMCEMLVLRQREPGDECVYSCTRFGNVLGSAGSVVPLFRRQILNGGPVTITDKRIIRYFMTIPEASQLVLQSGEMAKDGELFVLDMGKPVKILELAENMIRLMGYEPGKDIKIVETGLRPGEKLYEELLIKDEALSKTKNKLIFIEKETRRSRAEIVEKLKRLKYAIDTENEDEAREALKGAVETYHDPEEVNANAIEAEEMQMAAG